MYCFKNGNELRVLLALIVSIICTNAYAEDLSDLNKQTQNPVAALTSVPFQNNWTFKVGPEKSTQYVMNLQPVIPKQINKNWNLITRMVMPVTSQPRMTTTIPGGFGLSNTGFSFFLSPINNSDFIWGVGPIIATPATKRALGSSRWGLGPTAVALVQKDSWTVGALVNQTWTLGGTKGPNGINSLFVQPFISRSFWQTWNFAFTSETTVNWNASGSQMWTVPLDFVIVKVFTVGKQVMTLGAGPRYFPLFSGVHSKWGARLVVSFLFPNS
jgi:hypothetical protein